ncbi:hypothetical protein [Hymenobacter sp. AT01-02]|uniref:hypothetical protein n=1 Tax=Hymenobacter sp. AT01-02 TaxID=1571877 RepID=UPI0039772D08
MRVQRGDQVRKGQTLATVDAPCLTPALPNCGLAWTWPVWYMKNKSASGSRKSAPKSSTCRPRTTIKPCSVTWLP